MRKKLISKIFILSFALACLVLVFIFFKNVTKSANAKAQILQASWQKLNGPFGGQGYTIRFSPDNLNKIIVTDSFAGIHISYDGGLTWTESIDGIDARTGRSGDSVPVFVTTIDPNNPNRIWCGVKNAMGVFRSDDGGMTWQHKDYGLPGGHEVEIRGLAVKRGDSNVVFAGGDLEEIALPMGAFQRTQGIVYRTTDGGENWSLVLMGGNLFKDIIIDPNNPNTVYVASGIFDRHELTKTEGIYKSTDGGNTWAQVNSGIRNLYVTSLKFDPTNPNILWGTTGMLPQFPDDTTPYNGGIILSRDGGMTWTEAQRGRNDGNPQIYSAIGISPTNPNIIYAGAFGIFTKSTDGGMTWKETGFGPLGSNPGHPIDISVDPRDEKTVLVDSYIGGVFKSTDGGETWTSNAFGYSGAETRGVAVSPDGKTVFATSRAGIFLSEDKGINWLPVGLGDIEFDELQAIAIHPTDNNKILLGDSQNAMSSIFLSTDGGMIWKTVFMLFESDFQSDPSSKGLDGEIAFTDIKWSKSNPNVAFATCVKKSLIHDSEDSIGWGLFKSTDGGMSWKNKQNGINGFKNTWSVDIDPSDEKIIYVATNDRGIIKSTDGGESWKETNNGLQDVVSFHSVSVSPLNSQVVLAGSINGQFFKSENGGESWNLISEIDDFRANDRVVSIVFNPDASTHQVYAGCGATGFYVSNDDGNSWVQFNDGLSVRDIEDLAIAQDASAIYTATNGGGIFRLPLKGAPLTLTRKQIETPSNAGLDGRNNRNPQTSTLPSTTSSGGEVAKEFSLSTEGPLLDGLMIYQNKSSKSYLNIGFDQDKFDDSLLGSEVSITTELPKQAIRISPSKFALSNKESIQKVNISVSAAKKLKKIKQSIPEEISFTITQTTQGMSFVDNLVVPVKL